MAFAGIFASGGLRLFANELGGMTMAEKIEAGHIVQTGNRVENLLRLQEFNRNINQGIEDEIIIWIEPGTSNEERMELRFSNGNLRLFNDRGINSQGRNHYHIAEFDRLGYQMVRGRDIEYFLENSGGRVRLVSYRF
jgi:hypothetical protein